MKLEDMKDYNLLQEYGRYYGALNLLPNAECYAELNKIEAEIMRRMKSYKTNLPEQDIDKLLISEEYINNHKNSNEIHEVVEILINKINPSVEISNDSARLIICMDNSGSMGTFEKYCAKSFMLWNEYILRSLYSQVKKSLIHQTTEASITYDEELFYNKGDSGGTIISTGLNKINEVINSYDYDSEDTYIFIISDGDNLTSDNDRSVRFLDDLQRKAKHICYFEINQYNRCSTLLSGFRNVYYYNFSRLILREKSEIYEKLKFLWDRIGESQ